MHEDLVVMRRELEELKEQLAEEQVEKMAKRKVRKEATGDA
jgi:hypothetical protein